MAADALKARLVIRIGVTGHRLKALRQAEYDEPQLRDSIRSVLGKVHDYAQKILLLNSDIYRPEPPLLRVVSPLAEGSDRLVAAEALALGYEIQCPLPFRSEEYAKDFESPESEAEFCTLLDAATAMFELNGSREESEQAYKAVGHLVLRQSDILIAIWDGEPAKGTGGTAEVVQVALGSQIPVIWIESTPPHSASLLLEVTEAGKASRSVELTPSGPLQGQKIPSLKNRIEEILALPSEKEIFALQKFFGEKWPHKRYSLGYRLFCKLFVWGWKIPDRRVPRPEEDNRQDWLDSWNNLAEPNESVGPWIVRQFRPAFYRADRIADVLADRFRTFFVATYLFGAGAVLAAFLGAYPMVKHNHGLHGCFWIELLLITSILSFVMLNQRRHWHRRWIEYRLLAEGLRQMAALAPFARVTPSFEVPVHLGTDTGPTWYNWYFRALVRQAGMIKAFVDNDYVDHCRQALSTEIKGQIDYHDDRQKEQGVLHHRLHKISLILFIATFIACILHLYPKAAALFGDYTDFVLTGAALVLPAFGYAIQGIIYQGEFGRVSRRSAGIAKKLRELQDRLSSGKPHNFRELGRVAERFSIIQLQEQTDWRAVFIMKEVGV